MRTFTSDEVCAWIAGVGDLAAAVAGSTSLLDLLGLISKTACSLTGYEASGVLLVDDAHRRLVFSGSSGLEAGYIAKVNEEHTITLAGGPLAGGPSSRAFVTAQPVIIGDTLADPSFAPWAGLANEYGYRAIAAVPLLVDGEAVGTLNCYRKTVHEFAPEEVSLLRALANQAATALRGARLIASLTHERTLSERSEAIHREFTEVALHLGGVRGVAQTLAGLVRRPVLVTDINGATLASASYHGVQLASEPVEVPLPNDGVIDVPAARRVSAAVLLGREVAGRIWLPGPLDEFGEFDIRALEHAAVVCALEVLRQRTAVDVEWNLRSDLLADLLSTGAAEPLRARAESLGHDLNRPHTVVAAMSDGAPTAQASRELLGTFRATADQCHPKPLVTALDDHVVALWPGSQTGAIVRDAERVRRNHRQSGGTATVVIGHALEMVGDVRSSVATVRTALRIARLRGSDRVVSLPDLGMYGLLVQLTEPREVLQFSDRLLAPLREHDNSRRSGLVETVRTYLDSQMSTARTADALFVHQNTIGLRMRKIEQLIGVSMQDPETWLRFKVALMVEDVFGDAAD